METTNALTIILSLAIALFIFWDVVINKAFQNVKSSKENTVNAIIKADSKLYRSMVVNHAITNAIIDDMLRDTFWAEVIAESVK